MFLPIDFAEFRFIYNTEWYRQLVSRLERGMRIILVNIFEDPGRLIIIPLFSVQKQITYQQYTLPGRELELALYNDLCPEEYRPFDRPRES